LLSLVQNIIIMICTNHRYMLIVALYDINITCNLKLQEETILIQYVLLIQYVHQCVNDYNNQHISTNVKTSCVNE